MDEGRGSISALPIHHGVTLAAAGASFLREALPWVAAIIVAIAVMIVALKVIRKRVDSVDEVGSTMGFTLPELRDLHSSGALSDEEFERAKQQVIGIARGGEPDADADNGGPSGDEPKPA